MWIVAPVFLFCLSFINWNWFFERLVETHFFHFVYSGLTLYDAVHLITPSSHTYGTSKSASTGNGRTRNYRNLGRTEGLHNLTNVKNLSQKAVLKVNKKWMSSYFQSKTDSTIDMRGDIPDFTSSTELFTYIRHGVTRCTQQTPGRSLFLILRAFQDTLRKYSQVLSSKFLPQVTSINITSLAGSRAGDNSSASYRIQGGEEVTILHTDDTCDYCVDTVGALQDLIADRSNWGAMDYHSYYSSLLRPKIRFTLQCMSCFQTSFQNLFPLSYEPKAGRSFKRIIGLLTRDFEIRSQLLVRPNSILQRL